jgi:hypothetical protein
MPNNIVNHFVKKTGKSKDEIESSWNKAKDITKKQYSKVKEDSDDFYPIVVGVLKKMLGLSEEINAVNLTSTIGELGKGPKLMTQKRFEEKVKKNKKKPVIINDPVFTQIDK